MIQNYNTKPTTMDPVADLLLSEHPVAYRVSFARVVGGAMPALLLSQMYYWSNSKTAQERADNSFYMTQEEITEQTGLTRTETETARKKLREAGVLLEEKRGLPMKIWYRIDKDQLYTLLSQHTQKSDVTPTANLAENLQDGSSDAATNIAGNVQDDSRGNDTQSCEKPARLDAETQQDITKIPTETSAEIYTETTTTAAPVVDSKPAPVADAVVASSSVKSLVSRLDAVGVEIETARMLVKDYPDRVEAQLACLPYRDAKDNAAVLVSSIKGNWSAPQGFVDAQEAAQRRVREDQTRAEARAKLIAEQEERDARKAAFDKAWQSLSPEKRGELERQAWIALSQSGGPVAARAKDVLRGDVKGGEAMTSNMTRAAFTSALAQLTR